MHATEGFRISTVVLQLVASLLGLTGTALAILQALFWIPTGRANPSVLILIAFVPLIAAVVFALVPRRFAQDDARVYQLLSPMVCITLGLPLLLTVLVLLLIGINGNFDNFTGFVLLLAANTGRNLRDLARSLLRHVTEARI
jgi:hypothetical protein